MAKQKTNRQNLQEQVQVLYNQQGDPSSVLLPYTLFSRLVPRKARERLSSWITKYRPQQIYQVTQKEIVKAVDGVRQELFTKRYASKTNRPA